MNETYVADGRDDTAAGRVILMVSSSLAAVLVILGLIYAAGTAGRSQAVAAAAGCEPGTTSEAAPCVTQPQLLSQYSAVVTPANQQLGVDVATYAANEGSHLAAAETALKAEVTSENAFAASLAGIQFPTDITAQAAALVRAEQARAKLIAEQAQSSSLTRLRSFNHRVQVASTAVQTDMRVLLKAIDSPPPAG